MSEIVYTVKRSTRARYLRLTVRPGGAVILTAPLAHSERSIAAFVKRYADWIERAQKRMRTVSALPVSGRRDYKKYKEAARAAITDSVEAWSARLGYRYGRIAIKDTTSSWGSCSHKGNLNFSYKLLFVPRELLDYVVVHELCHLKEQNHSRAFWALVGQAIPDYAARRKALRRYILR